MYLPCVKISHTKLSSFLWQIKSGNNKVEIENYFKNADWLIENLVDQIIDHAPGITDMSIYQVNTSTIKPKSEFENSCSNIFMSGRRFVNYCQLEQYLTSFLEYWSIFKHRGGNSYIWFYSANEDRARLDPNKYYGIKYEINDLLKNQYRCIFKMSFNITVGKKYKYEYYILKSVNITKGCTSKHTCCMSIMDFSECL